ncbi:MAG: translation initiation factor IF-3, partial [Candidatus Firestonebacteria bacterium]|nr:translation initiation factor IF-3 [Candidatus Firestonebacteria bacterium]
MQEQRINEQIRAREVRVINSNGEQLGVMPLAEALKLAESQDHDLVEVSPDARPPVCKIFNFGKYRFELGKKEKEARKRQHTVQVKEIKFRPKIDTHDYQTKRNHVSRFLDDGFKVKVTIMYRGREMDHLELGRAILDRLMVDVTAVAGAAAEHSPRVRLEGVAGGHRHRHGTVVEDGLLDVVDGRDVGRRRHVRPGLNHVRMV